MTQIKVNGQLKTINSAPTKPLLWALREDCKMPGTKFGCGIGVCGACTVQVGGKATRSCITPVSSVHADVLTIEGLADANGKLHPVQQAWITEMVSQCGYCQPGQIMAAVALIAQHPNQTDAQIDSAMTNLCRCGTYPRIRAAILKAAQAMGGGT